MKLTPLILLFVATLAFGSGCKDLYPKSTPIVVPQATELCSSFYVSVYDVPGKRVVFTSERLKAGSLVGIMNRTEDFRTDPRLGSKSPKLSQYRNTGYDRGHMVPADDASNSREMNETFLLTNMTPQVPSLNQQAWKVLEQRLRNDHQRGSSETHILTIAEYKLKDTMNGIPVPSGYWKVVYSGGSTTYYFAPNITRGKVTRMGPVSLDSIIK